MGGFIFNGLFAALMVYLYIYIGDLKYTQVGGETLGPAGFPRLLIILILIGLAVVTVRDAIKLKKEAGSAEKENKPKIAKEDMIRLVSFSVLLVVYYIALQYIGFLISTLVLVFGIVMIIGYKKAWVAALFAIALTLLIAFVFGELFNVALPRGFGFFRELSLYIY